MNPSDARRSRPLNGGDQILGPNVQKLIEREMRVMLPGEKPGSEHDLQRKLATARVMTMIRNAGEMIKAARQPRLTDEEIAEKLLEQIEAEGDGMGELVPEEDRD